MIVIMKAKAEEEDIHRVVDTIESLGLRTQLNLGAERVVVAVIGDVSKIGEDNFFRIRAMKGVENTIFVSKPYKLVSKDFKKEQTVIDVEGVKIGGKKLVVFAGPCSVENREQIMEVAEKIKKAGASMIRGGAFKPRTSPKDFQGLGEEGLKLLYEAKEETGLPIVTEIMDARDVQLLSEYADILQVGTRNMQNYTLLKELGKCDKPILLKRGMWATMAEFLGAAEYIMNGGNENVILCERGIRTFSDYSRNTLDLSIIPAIKDESHLPIISDPSHGTGKRSLVLPMSKASVACGADGLLIETHPDPDRAISDADQTISLSAFSKLMEDVKQIAKAVGREL